MPMFYVEDNWYWEWKENRIKELMKEGRSKKEAWDRMQDEWRRRREPEMAEFIWNKIKNWEYELNEKTRLGLDVQPYK